MQALSKPISMWSLGLNHNSADIDIRGKLVFSYERLQIALKDLHGIIPNAELVLLSTCNRTEICACADNSYLPKVMEWLAHSALLPVNLLLPHLYTFYESEMVRHVFRIASGLDSMIIGETQIVSQLKNALNLAKSQGVIGGTLDKLFQHSFAVSKNVRTLTKIGRGQVSYASVVVTLCQQLFGNLQNLDILFVGAGEIIELCRRHFQTQKVRSFGFVNRNFSKAQILANQLHGKAYPMEQLIEILPAYDVVIICTSSSLPLIGLGAMERAVKVRKHRPMLVADLAVPRNVELEVKELADIYVYNLDELGHAVESGLNHRQQEIEQAQTLIDTEVSEFCRWYENREITLPIIKQLQHASENWKLDVVNKAKKQLLQGQNPEQVLTQLAQNSMQRTLHGTLHELRNGLTEEKDQAIWAAQKFFLQNK